MRRWLTGRSGLVLAFLLGVLISIAGTATAARLITGAQIKNGTVTSRDLSKGVRAQLARAGRAGPAGPPGRAGAKGDRGDAGPPGSARAYGHIAPDGTLLRGKNVVSVQKAGVGEYCVTLDPSIDPATVVPAASPDFARDSTGVTQKAEVEWDSGGCSVAVPLKFLTYLVTASASQLSVTKTDNGFSFVVG